ncbi:arginine N-succinyltransferase [Acinetobacter sp. C26M]|uniref:Arginine N-succinyltransferase n=1 Tax=Acinetobacter dispersus TaxID=70348 RepID=N9SUQ4_9GAMM|nr:MULTISPECIES: arginine N-succinyltransferase [Acinetobacter]ENW92899.1 arginine N-succinyltransferase [Acinetobacter dispersus]ENX54875.1 arginine N-succinyltransferase [Acinetobacter dispersus]MCU4335659.1 arginine N-succinyltransferase [Acinetobacter dispersus]USA47567.1 arginine N-succinyltransferase [Acinetobacter sp. C26M]USA51048.1 arginine N-succinyltransferase [Acinetobacter sp. C26G]
MMIVRHAAHRDLDDIYRLAQRAGESGIGLTSLPQNKEILAERITRTTRTLDGLSEKCEASYLFVLEDTSIHKIVGVSAIEVAVGLNEPFYNFRVAKQVHASKALNVYKTLDTLFLSNDHTGCSELCTLFLDPEYRKNQNGKFLSKVRFLFIAAFRSFFEERLIAEMRGFSDQNGQSPFWDSLGYLFFNMDFAAADYLSGVGQKAFIAELMPRFPVYVDLLSSEAREVIAEVHPHTLPAAKVLMSEGLKYQGYVDIFDAGPTLEANTAELRAVKESRLLKVKLTEQVESTETHFLVANDQYQDYAVLLINNKVDESETLHMTAAQAQALNIAEHDQVRVLALEKMENN